MSEIPSYAKEVINESIFYESKNLINNQFLKKNTYLFTQISNNSETFFFSEKLFLNLKQNVNLKINKEVFFSSSDFEKIFFCYDSIINKKKIEKIYENLNITYEKLSSINGLAKKFNIINISTKSSFILKLEK